MIIIITIIIIIIIIITIIIRSHWITTEQCLARREVPNSRRWLTKTNIDRGLDFSSKPTALPFYNLLGNIEGLGATKLSVSLETSN